jgi:acyl dehydratase
MTSPWPPGEHEATSAHDVTREAVSRFAAAVRATDPAHHDPDAARAAGHPDVVAPPTFPIAFLVAAQERILASPTLDFDYSRVVHREQHFAYSRPLHAGQRVTVVTGLTSLETLRGNAIAQFGGRLDDATGVTICTIRATVVSRAAARDEVPA